MTDDAWFFRSTFGLPSGHQTRPQTAPSMSAIGMMEKNMENS